MGKSIKRNDPRVLEKEGFKRHSAGRVRKIYGAKTINHSSADLDARDKFTTSTFTKFHKLI
jgi:hypothetical protein